MPFPGTMTASWRAMSAIPGIALIAMGIVILIWPEILAYMIAFVFILLGCAFVAAALRFGRHVTHHQIYETWRVDGAPEEPPDMR
jgi:hypothetical protein